MKTLARIFRAIFGQRRPRSVMRVTRTHAYVCAWCDSKDAGDRWAAGRGLRVSHGICQPHKAQQISLIPST